MGWCPAEPPANRRPSAMPSMSGSSICIEVAAGRVPVIAGAGSNATDEAVSLTRHAKAAGADAALLVTPYYNKPGQEGLYRHYRAIAHAVDLPLILYNVPGRTNVDIHTDTLARLAADCPTIIGLKDATADLARPLAIRERLGPDFRLLSGEDATALAFLASGGVGCISVTANVAPGPCARLQNAWREGRVEEAMALNHRLFPLHDALFLEPSPQPVKYAASLLGLADEAPRLPLVPVGEATRAAVRDAMAAAGIGAGIGQEAAPAD